MIHARELTPSAGVGGLSSHCSAESLDLGANPRKLVLLGGESPVMVGHFA